jgi:hypothetical protein
MLPRSKALIISVLAGVILMSCSTSPDQSAPDRTAEALLRALGNEEYEKACSLYVPQELERMGMQNCLQLASVSRGLVGGRLAATAVVSGYEQEGDRAFVGSANIQINGQSTFIPLRFLRLNGQWYLTDRLFSIN